MFELAIIAIVLVLFLVEPAYYRLKSKGYDPAPFLWLTALLSFTAFFRSWENITGILTFTIPSIGLYFLTKLLKTRPGAAGASYLDLSTTCPNCQTTTRFERKFENSLQPCPSCGETLSLGEAPKKSSPPSTLSSEETEDTEFVLLDKFLFPYQAELARDHLTGSGIKAWLFDEYTAHAHPALQFASGGVRLMVQDGEQNRAREILNEITDSDALEEEYAKTPYKEIEVPRDWGVPLVFSLIALCMIIPSFIYLFWSIAGGIEWVQNIFNWHSTEPLPYVISLRFSIVFGAIVMLARFINTRKA